MSAATQPIDTPSRAGDVINIPVEAATTIWAGSLVARNANGNAVPSADTAGLYVFGRAEETAYNVDGAAGAISVQVRRGLLLYNISTASPVTQVNIGSPVYVADDNTVAAASTNHIVAGLLVEVTSDGHAWVDTRNKS